MTPMLDTSVTMRRSIRNTSPGLAGPVLIGFLKVCNVSSVSNSTGIDLFWDWEYQALQRHFY
ncbi:ADS_G0016230.mRNA.1.CDS.1 [Saccharomyces cerevisiae]|nr:ADS_G0016230.mRNA.1.CDS.1 [Saccharomyces cerevisiae]CAI6635613.1 ADS_G0016230.mRNA.1.CDS.1 [Saccharomyces cerevisiae]